MTEYYGVTVITVADNATMFADSEFQKGAHYFSDRTKFEYNGKLYKILLPLDVMPIGADFSSDG